MVVQFDSEDQSVIGKKVLIGVTYYDEDEKEIGRGQWWGTVLAYNRHEGLIVNLSDSGRKHAFPPVPGALRPAAPGRYELESTGEVVTDPDFLCTLSRTAS